MRRLSPVQALEPPRASSVTVTTPRPHRHFILQGRQTWTSTTSSNNANSTLASLFLHPNLPRYSTTSCMLAISPSIATTTASSRLRRLSISGAMASAFSAYHGPAATASQHTITALGRWSVLNNSLPGSCCIMSILSYHLLLMHNANSPSTAVDKIKSLHVYDFDNTREFAPQSMETYMHLTPSSIQDPSTESPTLERAHDWDTIESGNVRQWRLVA